MDEVCKKRGGRLAEIREAPVVRPGLFAFSGGMSSGVGAGVELQRHPALEFHTKAFETPGQFVDIVVRHLMHPGP
jgi:hypothetical protein